MSGEAPVLPGFRVPPDRTLAAQVEALRRELSDLKRAQAGKPKRRTDPDLTGLYPQKAGGVSVYLRGVGSNIKRALYYVGIARDQRAARDMQERVLQVIEWTLADPNEAAALLAYWEARGRAPWLTVPQEQPRVVSLPVKVNVAHPFGTAIQLAGDK